MRRLKLLPCDTPKRQPVSKNAKAEDKDDESKGGGEQRGGTDGARGRLDDGQVRVFECVVDVLHQLQLDRVRRGVGERKHIGRRQRHPCGVGWRAEWEGKWTRVVQYSCTRSACAVLCPWVGCDRTLSRLHLPSPPPLPSTPLLSLDQDGCSVSAASRGCCTCGYVSCVLCSRLIQGRLAAGPSLLPRLEGDCGRLTLSVL